MGVTLRDIAARAEADVSTVSRVLNHKGLANTSEQTRKRILALAREMNYQPHLQARWLRRGRSGLIGVVVLDFNDPAQQEYLRELDERLTGHGMFMVPMSEGRSSDRQRQCFELLSGRVLDGMICLDYQPANEPLYRTMRQAGRPIVFRATSDLFDRVSFDCVGIDLVGSWQVMSEHLFEQGYRRIGVLGDFPAGDFARPAELPPNLQGYVRAHEQFGIEPDSARVIEVDPDPCRTSERLEATFRRQPDLIDALLVRSPRDLLGSVRAIEAMGWRVGPDIGLASFGNTHEARLFSVPVTMGGQPTRQVGQALVELLLARLEGGEPAIEKRQYASQLMVRASTCGPGRRRGG